MNTKIAIINVHSSCNAGDAALTQVAIDELRKEFPESQIILVMNDPQSHLGEELAVLSFLTWVNLPGFRPAVRFAWLAILCMIPALTLRIFGKAIFLPFSKDIRKTIETIINSDMVVGTPGGYFYSYGKGRNLMYLSFTLFVAILAGKPLYLLPQSFGPMKYARERWMTRWLLSRARIVMARESVSLDYLETLDVNTSSCYLLPDMAFAFRGAPPSRGEDWIKAQGLDPHIDRPLLGMTVIDWGAQYQGFSSQNQYENAITAVIRHFVDQYHGKVILFPQSWGPSAAEDDRLPAQRIANLVIELGESVMVVDQPLPPQVLKSTFGQMDLFIGTRMHSNIFAMTENVPFIAIGYLHKTLGIARTASLEDWVVNIQQVDKNQLNAKLDQLWIERDHIHSQLIKMMPEMSEKVHKAGLLIAQDYASLTKGKIHA